MLDILKVYGNLCLKGEVIAVIEIYALRSSADGFDWELVLAGTSSPILAEKRDREEPDDFLHTKEMAINHLERKGFGTFVCANTLSNCEVEIFMRKSA